ncbi:unnamed protein product [Kuraishia capsulata CBS 1993]|uniref:Aminoacyl-transfer RNA synthetases class-II family profile domain-containing protein n=1 Tax=Kuraishia capsulata CBS 1993 TaxID=1382522 RepID=W6MMG9_9ASCO|nr:uncharacterized protein KUCA_T00003376001 [Kuraishia capsulata CBS 1993]CDK27398.1 unnamed protein product [Kuraishia capsulata CBS 1993]
MASGVKNYYQIAKCFRDEDLRADRQPEFTQIDMEMAFADAGDVREVVEKVVINIWRDTRELPLYKAVDDTQLTELKATESFPRLTYKEALFKYGIDKPDLRYTHTFIDLTEFTSEVKGNSKFPIFEVCILRDLKNKCSGKIPSEIFSDLEYRDRKPVVVEIRSTEDWTDAFAPLVRFDPTRLEELKLKLHLQEGDVIAGSTRAEFPYENPTPLGKFRQIAIKELPEQYRRALVDGNGTLIEKPLEDVFVASWVVDFPLFSPSEQESADKSGYPTYDESKIVSTHHPFTMVHLDDFDQLFTNPLEVRGEHYDLVINGVEVGGGSRRVHHPELQRYIFKSILGIEDPDILFGHLLQAFATGCPPHAGLAIGFDRMCAMLLGITSIRDVIAFPKNQAGVDAVVNSPSKVTQQALGNYHIKVAKE